MNAKMLAATLAAVLVAGPALAQGQAPMQPGDPALREMERARANPGGTPWVPAQDRNAAEADYEGVENARGLLAEARAALTRRRMGFAIEALERAETRLLTNSVVASEAGRPQSSAALSQISTARRLAAQGDARSALNALDRAEAALPATPTGPGARPLPPGVPTAVDAPARGPRPRQGARPAVPPAPPMGYPAQTMPRG
ncbi:hypothetical protein J8J14_07405 [Roseomonas sp. SSH11]|uniref:DUF4398 domain-containing protein n=1 Tax=Pararoseomonas baculiformis TaxID=2820812 RepID=A0ABS4AC62_9PROT|nr:hypothetical protein [Pararoseomonas baculiformis]MBP0444607.1 hypothetical protein [Pararoseomonas baculiformis]